jgi:uncharacterized membrane protein (GlpM family)
MKLYVIKVLLTTLTVVGVVELSKRAGTFWGGLLASLPLTSLIVFVWLYADTGNNQEIAALSWSIFWLVLPSLILFVALPLFLKRGFSFPLALTLGLALMACAYVLTAAIVRRFGIHI